MTLLFDAPLIDGLNYQEALMGRDEEKVLLDRLMPLELAPFRFHGWTGNRKTQSFGWRYDFDDASFTPTEQLPDWLLPLRDKAAAFADLEPRQFAHVLWRATIRARASAGTAIATSSNRWSAYR